ncbi:MAG: exodeoxyribonuclease V subunit gamma [Corallococcus sp.]|nr:exodeoxyribonuclease V subunit gamma [Corallococcus sp.]MCM1359140.1 exodeoxyribonuclease V subunit gamma [Corallococcus sp.]MCM1394530.1 exodeoxyribonuclease V subunit gamma [Corallococcus sp.]
MSLQNLNDAQIRAVTAPLKPTLVLAGAGTGKTRVLTNRILYLVSECGVDPSEILAITFTNKAAAEMKRRLFDFDCNAQFMHVSTIHSFCASVLRVEAQAFNRTGNFSIYAEDEKRSLLKKIVKDLSDDADAKTVDDICEGISELKNNSPELLTGSLAAHDGTFDDVLENTLDKMQHSAQVQDREKLIKIIDEYSAKMAESNALDFDDLLFYVHKLFSEFPDVLDKYRERYKYILIDEFQDTNRVQYRIFKMLGEKYGNIFVVGDDDQSIYSWRGAESHNLLKFSQDFADCQIFKLEQNYRSTKKILNVANDIIAKNINRFDKVLWTENEEGVKTQLFSGYSEQDEAYFVCEQIKNLLFRSDGMRLKDFAILMRINALSRSFEQELQRNRIAYKVFGGFKFYERKEIKDILAYLRLIVNPCDSEAFLRAVNVPRKRGIGETTLSRLRNFSADYGISLVEVISDERNMEDLNRPTRAKLSDFYQLYTDLCSLAQKLSLKAFVHTMLDVLEFRKVYSDAGEDDRVLNVDEFEESVNEFCHSQPYATLSDFLQTVSLSSDIDEADDTDYVTIATIHAVKGLEFKVVFIVGMEDGIFPTSRATYQAETMQEERRLMYVAATRAEKRLYLTRANSRFLWGQRKQTIASRYFAEVQRFLQPERPPASEWQLSNDAFLDKLINSEPSKTAVSNGKSSAEISKFKVGQIVEHSTFGKGIILRISGETADVAFDTAGKKSLNVRFAPMTIIK